MDAFIIHGGNRLTGDIVVNGAKNSALPILCATLLNGAENHIQNVPYLRDINTIEKLLVHLGCNWERDGNSITVDSSSIDSMEAPYDLVKTMRASVLVMGPLIARFGYVKISQPGGCAIGTRPINLHLNGLKKMGAEINLDSGYVEIKARKLKGARIYLDIPTVTGTENLMMAAVLAKGETILENAAMEPEIIDLAKVLIRMGAKIEGYGTDRIIIQGVETLKNFKHTVIPDRIEAGTFLIAGLITKGNLNVCKMNPKHLSSVLIKLKGAGAVLDIGNDFVRIKTRHRPHSVDIKTLPFPGFPTDMQAQFMTLMTVSDGLSIVTETIFENRFMHVSELARMGADIRIEGNNAIITGKKKLSGAPVMATDLRASACLVIGGLVAEGETLISRVYHIDRGYERIEERLSAIGADIVRINK